MQQLGGQARRLTGSAAFPGECHPSGGTRGTGFPQAGSRKKQILEDDRACLLQDSAPLPLRLVLLLQVVNPVSP